MGLNGKSGTLRTAHAGAAAYIGWRVAPVILNRGMSSDSLPVASPTPDAQTSQQPGLFELFFAFAKMSLAGFGGVLVWARRAIVEQHRWMTPEEFNEAFALCHFLPGPNIVNLSVVFGGRFRGIPGSIAAFLGLVGPPVVIVTILAAVYARYGQIPALQRSLTGVSCAAIGLFLAVIGRMMVPLLKNETRLRSFCLLRFLSLSACCACRWCPCC